MNIKILSHTEALPEVKSHSKEYNVIFITSPDNPFYRPEMHDLVIHAKKALVCMFQDNEFEGRDSDGPKKDHIAAILEFAKDKDNFVVSCHAGVSRSSASAFVIACSREDPKEAVKILDKRRHDPNSLIVKYGSELLNKPEMIKIIEQFKFDMMKEVYGY
jgi:predicted protein tyrosine phosphatase